MNGNQFSNGNKQLLKEAKEDMDKDKSPKGKGMILIIGHGDKKLDKGDKKDSACAKCGSKPCSC